MRLLIAVLVIANAGCFTSPTEPGAPDSVVTLRYGQTATVDGVRISFTEILDSRCPEEVVCAWAGDAAVRLESMTSSVVLHTNLTAGTASGRLAAVTITLVAVKPERISLDEPKKGDYVVALRISE